MGEKEKIEEIEERKKEREGKKERILGYLALKDLDQDRPENNSCIYYHIGSEQHSPFTYSTK